MNTRPNFTLIALVLAIMLAASCTPQKRLVYMQDKQESGSELAVRPDAYRLKPGDILHVNIMTSDPTAQDLFNLDMTRRLAQSRTTDIGDPNMYLYGYTINAEGNIIMPVIGPVHVANCTLDEAQELIQDRAGEYLVDATASVKIVNFSVTVLGEVRRAGSFYVYDHEFTVLDAIGMAGDLTDYGNRRIHVIRQTSDGIQFDRIDITDRRSVTSPLYYLQPNDVVYVEPLIAKRFGFAQFPFGVVFSAITTTLLLINFLQ
jgi:polysaccharide biosynthesis/export protein